MDYRRIALSKEGVFGWRSDFECAVGRGKGEMAASPDLPWLRRKCQPRLAREIDPASSIYVERPTKTSGEGLANCLRFPQIGETTDRKFARVLLGAPLDYL